MNYLNDIFQHFQRLFQWWCIVLPWELGIRVRLGKKSKLLLPGTYFRIPFLDSVFIQSIRLRVTNLPIQTLTTKDGKTVTVAPVVGFSIQDILKLYNTLSHVEATVSNIVLSEISAFISSKSSADCGAEILERAVTDKLSACTEYGIKFEYVKIVGYAVVRTYRLIQDSHWIPDSISTDNKT